MRKADFEHVVKEHMKRAYFAALGFVGNHHDALDLSQEAFATAYKNFHGFDRSRPFFPSGITQS